MRKEMTKKPLNAKARMFLGLVPVYPAEISLSAIARATGLSNGDVRVIMYSLVADIPLAERLEGKDVLLCFPSMEARTQAGISDRRK